MMVSSLLTAINVSLISASLSRHERIKKVCHYFTYNKRNIQSGILHEQAWSGFKHAWIQTNLSGKIMKVITIKFAV